MVVLAEFVTVENTPLSISTEKNSAIALFCVEPFFFIGQKTSCDLLNQLEGKPKAIACFSRASH